MEDLTIRPFRSNDEEGVIKVWHACGLTVPWNNPQRDIERKLQVKPEWFLIGEAKGQLVATCMIGYDGHRGWLYYLGVHPDHQGKGWGRELVAHAESILRRAGCPKINLQVRSTNQNVIQFYESLGFSSEATLSMGKRLESDEPFDVQSS